MIRLNLLPHREERRRARRRQFISLCVSLAVLGLAVVALGHAILSNQIENQNSRNSLMKGEIAKLDEQIKEIDKLREQTLALLSRKQIVETLQTNRTEAVHLLDQIVRQIPDGIYLRSVKQNDNRVTLIGFAQSNARVSTLMRNIEGSPWLEKPALVEIKAVQLPNNAGRVNEFTLNLLLKRAAPPVIGGGPEGAPAKGAPAKGGPGKTAAVSGGGAG